MQTSEGVTVREVEFAYSDLWAAIHALNDLSQYAELLEGVTAFGWHLDVIGNRVVVELYDFTEEAIDLFRSTVFDAPLLVFVQSDGPITFDCDMLYADALQDSYHINAEEMSITPFNTIMGGVGAQIVVRRNGDLLRTGSIGYRATLGGARGFITSAHLSGGLQNGDQIYLVIGGRATDRIGRVANANHVRLQGFDAAFITLEPNVDIRNTTAGVAISSHIISHFFVGQEIAATGASTGSRFGQVTSPSGGTFVGTIVTVNNTVVSNLARQTGDSGGIVFCLFSGGVIGIHVGGNNTIAHASRATEINRALGSSVRP